MQPRRQENDKKNSLVSAVNDVAAFAQAFGEQAFHLQRFGIRHGIEMRVQTRDEPFAEAADNASRLDALLVILEALLGREAGHADVVGSFAVAAGVSEVDDVDVMVDAGPTAGILSGSNA